MLDELPRLLLAFAELELRALVLARDLLEEHLLQAREQRVVGLEEPREFPGLFFFLQFV